MDRRNDNDPNSSSRRRSYRAGQTMTAGKPDPACRWTYETLRPIALWGLARFFGRRPVDAATIDEVISELGEVITGKPNIDAPELRNIAKNVVAERVTKGEQREHARKKKWIQAAPKGTRHSAADEVAGVASTDKFLRENLEAFRARFEEVHPRYVEPLGILLREVVGSISIDTRKKISRELDEDLGRFLRDRLSSTQAGSDDFSFFRAMLSLLASMPAVEFLDRWTGWSKRTR